MLLLSRRELGLGLEKFCERRGEEESMEASFGGEEEEEDCKKQWMYLDSLMKRGSYSLLTAHVGGSASDRADFRRGVLCRCSVSQPFSVSVFLCRCSALFTEESNEYVRAVCVCVCVRVKSRKSSQPLAYLILGVSRQTMSAAPSKPSGIPFARSHPPMIKTGNSIYTSSSSSMFISIIY